MPLEDFIITTYCFIEDWLKISYQGTRLRQRGPQPKLSDAEVMTMEIVGEFLGIDTDKGIHMYFKHHHLHLFPNLGDRSAFVRQGSNLWACKQRFRTHLLHHFNTPDAPVQIIDGFPLPVCHIRRAASAKTFRGEAHYGYCASKDEHYYGFKGHLLIDHSGLILDCTVTPANTDERLALWDMVESINGMLLGDKGYICNELAKSELEDNNINLQTPLRRNMTDQRPKPFNRWMNKTRRRIETVIAQLSERFNIEKVRARDIWHFTNRITRKITAHTWAMLINQKNQRNPLALDAIIA